MTKDSIDKVAKARAESSGIVLELYCEQTNCAARQVVITIRDHDNILVERLAARQPCPLCGKPLKFHKVETFARRQAVDERDARMSVNRQMYLIHENPDGFVPGNVLFDDRLPPTPCGWFPPRAELSPRTFSTSRAGSRHSGGTGITIE
jgi:hypothetical protein